MIKKLKYSFIILIFITIISYGFIKTSSELPDFIKDRSSFKVSLNTSPFDLRFEMGNYIVYLNDKVFLNIKKGTTGVLNSLGSKNTDDENSEGTDNN